LAQEQLVGHRWRLGGAGISEVALGDFPGIFGWNSPQMIFPDQKSPGDSRMDIFRRMFHNFSEKNVFFSWRSFQKTDIEATDQNGFSLGGSHFAGVWQTISNNAFLAN